MITINDPNLESSMQGGYWGYGGYGGYGGGDAAADGLAPIVRKICQCTHAVAAFLYCVKCSPPPGGISVCTLLLTSALSFAFLDVGQQC